MASKISRVYPLQPFIPIVSKVCLAEIGEPLLAGEMPKEGLEHINVYQIHIAKTEGRGPQEIAEQLRAGSFGRPIQWAIKKASLIVS